VKATRSSIGLKIHRCGHSDQTSNVLHIYGLLFGNWHQEVTVHSAKVYCLCVGIRATQPVEDVFPALSKGIATGRTQTGTYFALKYPAACSPIGAPMKIYLLVLLIGALFTAIHFTAAPEAKSKSVHQ
jgi:hypothetical protein